MIDIDSFPIPVMAMKTKEALLLLPHSVFPWHGAKKGTDRTYARPDALAHSKKRGFHFIYQLINKVKFLHISCIV